MRSDFQNISSIHEDKGALFVRWENGKVDLHTVHEKENFIKQYRIWLAQQESPDDRICDLDKIDKDGVYSRAIENENKRNVMSYEEKEKHDRFEENADGVFQLLSSVGMLQKKSETYIDEIVNFQKNTIMALKDSQAFLMKGNVTKWELKRLESLIKTTTECRKVGEKINEITLQILEDWII